MARRKTFNRAILTAFAGAIALAAVWSVDAPAGLEIAAMYGIPLAVGALAGLWSVVIFPLMLAGSAIAGNEVAPSAWSGEDTMSLLFIASFLTLAAASVRELIRRPRVRAHASGGGSAS